MQKIQKQTLLLRSCHVLFQLFCIISLMYQTLDISKSYFKYVTLSRISFQLTQNRPLVAASLCIRYSDIFDWSKFSRDMKLNPMINRTNAGPAQRHAMTLPTLRQILDYTPAPKQTLKSVLYRKPNSFLMYSAAGDQTDEVFKVVKHYCGEFMCYMIIPNDRGIHLFRMAVSSLLYSKTLYILTVGDALLLTNNFQLTAFFHASDSSLPLWSRMYSAALDRLYDFDSLQPQATEFKFSYSNSNVSLMEYPYDTACRKGALQTVCERKCLLQAYNRIGRLPFRLMFSEPSDLKPVNTEDLDNSTINSFVMETDENCKQKCKLIACRYTMTTTSLLTTSLDREKNEFKIVMELPVRPETHIDAVPQIELIGFISYVCGCLGTWLGVYVLALNPFKFLIQRKRRKLVNKESNRVSWQLVTHRVA